MTIDKCKIYFDNAASTPVAHEVTDAMSEYLNINFGNPSSIHSFGRTAKVLIEDSRDLIASYIGSKPKEIYFTSGGTEANNMALKGFAFKNLLSRKKHIISSSIEHSAVFETLKYLKERFDFNITFVKPDKNGFINIKDIEKEIRPNTLLISIMHSNNETGVINDISLISELAHSKEIVLHSDSVQSIGKTHFNVTELGLDFATISAHKIYGPKGIGALYINENVKIDNLIHGGQQERNLRAGTENISAIAGFKKSVELLKKNYENDIKIYKSLNSFVSSRLKEHFRNKISFNSPEENSLPNILNVSFSPEEFSFDPEMLLIMLDMNDIAVSGGSACTSGSLKPSKVLLELGKDEKSALASLRISFGRYNSITEAEKLVEVLKNIIK